MANPLDKHPQNAPGKYYNDLSCIDCDQCRDIAPDVFTRDDDEGLSYVWKQPAGPEQIALAEEARSACPTISIGNDG